jgi:deoxycytidylate deaminase
MRLARGAKANLRTVVPTEMTSPTLTESQPEKSDIPKLLEPADDGIELVFGLVGPTGVDLGKVAESLRAQLKTVRYETVLIRLSKLIAPYVEGKEQPYPNEYQRIKTLMELGTTLRENTEQHDIVGRLGIANICAERKKDTGKDYSPKKRAAYVISSFKRPEEVDLYRQIYGKAFTLISVYSPRQSRINDLAGRLRSSVSARDGDDKRSAEELAVELVNRDYAEEGRQLGQRVGDTFPLADYFVSLDSKPELDRHLLRLIQLTFGHPYISPTRDEQAMFFAQAASARSLDLSRQVGAAIVDDDGAILSTGCNEVPKYGGGLYWGEDVDRARDYERGYDSNARVKHEMLEDLFDRLKGSTTETSWLTDEKTNTATKDLALRAMAKGSGFFKNSVLADVIEFGRAVHAEAAAITDAARRGIAVKNGRLFCTTFPCHICARHIVASGVREVVFIEPYEKSRTGELYFDSVSVEPHEVPVNKASFRAFVGVAPRRYIDSFQMLGKRKNDDGRVLDMDEIASEPKIKRIVLTYLAAEQLVITNTKKYAVQKEQK